MDQTGRKASILPLRASDLVFNRKSDGIMSGGYKVSNALLNSTLNVQHGGGGGRQLTKDRKTSEYDIKTAKLMEDLIVPSGLYYCHPITKHKVFNHKVSKKVKASDSDDEYDRRRRDKFRGERNEYRGAGESGRREERGNARREEWTER